MLPREHGGQGAQEDPHAAPLHGEMLQKHTQKHTSLACRACLLVCVRLQPNVSEEVGFF